MACAKNLKNVKMILLNSAINAKDLKKMSDYCKIYNEIYEDCKCHLEYVTVTNKRFTFTC